MKPLFVAALLVLGTPELIAQKPTAASKQDEKKQAAKRQARAKQLLEDWMKRAARDRTEEPLGKVVDAVMAAETPGLDLLRARVAAVDVEQQPKLANALHTVVCHVGLRWIDKVDDSGAVFAGQYGPLRKLMPDIGDFYFELLLDTPQWFPVTKRYKVIPALRDLYREKPDRKIVERVDRMARDELEPAYLRVGLSYALAQWGRRELIKKKLHELEKKARSKDEEIALAGTRDLAVIHYDLREYAMAAVYYRDLVKLAIAAEELQPLYYYNLACCLCLSGDKRSALQALEQALDYNDSPNIDSSVRLKRKLFDNDPEIRSIRKHPRIVKAMERAFGKDTSDTSGKSDSKRKPPVR